MALEQNHYLHLGKATMRYLLLRYEVNKACLTLPPSDKIGQEKVRPMHSALQHVPGHPHRPMALMSVVEATTQNNN